MKCLRKTPLPKCGEKNCIITSSNRGSCSECRFKKCVEAGMNMNRSRYGRHSKKACTMYSPDVGGSLCTLLSNLKTESGLKVVTNKTLSLLNDTIIEFYFRALELLLSTSDSQQETEDLDVNDDDLNDNYFSQSNAAAAEQTPSSSNVSLTFSDQTYLSQSSSGTPTLIDYSQSMYATPSRKNKMAVTLPKSMIMFFCYLFDIEIHAEESVCYSDSAIKSKRDISWFMKESKYKEILAEYKEFSRFIEETILEQREIFPTLKIALFMKAMRVLLENNFLKEDSYDKRISDLMKSELALIYMNRQNQANVQQNLSASRMAPTFPSGSQGSSSSNSLHALNDSNQELNNTGEQLSLSSSLNSSLLSCFSIFARINSLVLKHLNNEELEVFVFQRCFDLHIS